MFFVFFFWELYQPAGCYRLSSAVLRKLGMVWLSADGPANSHFDFFQVINCNSIEGRLPSKVVFR